MLRSLVQIGIKAWGKGVSSASPHVVFKMVMELRCWCITIHYSVDDILNSLVFNKGCHWCYQFIKHRVTNNLEGKNRGLMCQHGQVNLFMGWRQRTSTFKTPGNITKVWALLWIYNLNFSGETTATLVVLIFLLRLIIRVRDFLQLNCWNAHTVKAESCFEGRLWLSCTVISQHDF